MQTVADALASLTLGAPAQFRNLTVFPLIAPEDKAPGYLLLDDALERKFAHVTEVSESGHVPELLFCNDGVDKVLLVDGEELVGARQNRILNLTILVGGEQHITVPVSCVEQGRWAWKSRHFSSSKQSLFARARAKKMRQVSASLRECREARSDQGEIWSDIGSKLDAMRVHSNSSSMEDAYTHQSGRIDEFVQAIAPAERQAGAVFAINGKIVGMECFDSATTFRRFMEKLVRSYAMDAIEYSDAAAKPPVETVVRRFLDDMKAAALERFPTVGEGEALRFESETLSGGALVAGDRVVHLCAFQVEKPDPRQRAPRGYEPV